MSERRYIGTTASKAKTILAEGLAPGFVDFVSIEQAKDIAAVMAYAEYDDPVVIEAGAYNTLRLIPDWRTNHDALSRLGFSVTSGLGGDVLQVVHDTVKFGLGEKDAGLHVNKRHNLDDEEKERKKKKGAKSKSTRVATPTQQGSPTITAPAPVPQAQSPGTKQPKAKPAAKAKPASKAKTSPKKNPVHKQASKSPNIKVPLQQGKAPQGYQPTKNPLPPKPAKDGPAARRKSTPEDVPAQEGTWKKATKEAVINGKRHGKDSITHIKVGDEYKITKTREGISLYRHGDSPFMVNPADANKLK